MHAIIKKYTYDEEVIISLVISYSAKQLKGRDNCVKARRTERWTPIMCHALNTARAKVGPLSGPINTARVKVGQLSGPLNTARAKVGPVSGPLN